MYGQYGLPAQLYRLKYSRFRKDHAKNSTGSANCSWTHDIVGANM